MAQLIDASGNICGNFADGETPPTGFWTIPDASPVVLDRYTYLTRMGPANVGAIFAAVLSEPAALAYDFFLGFAADNIYLSESYGPTVQFETAGVIPVGATQAIWNQ